MLQGALILSMRYIYVVWFGHTARAEPAKGRQGWSFLLYFALDIPFEQQYSFDFFMAALDQLRQGSLCSNSTRSSVTAQE